MTESPAASPTLDELRAWFFSAKDGTELKLALKHRDLMQPAVVAELKARWPNSEATDEERELGLVFSLAQIADKLDMVAMLMASLGVQHLPPASPTVTVSHVDPAPPSGS